MKINIARCTDAMKQIRVFGDPRGPVRQQAIADAIAAIQTKPDLALAYEYIGVKNYAHFGDQRSDHPYGFRPTHGSIVFRIERNNEAPTKMELGLDEIYLLECVRDFGVFDWPVPKIEHGAITTTSSCVFDRFTTRPLV